MPKSLFSANNCVPKMENSKNDKSDLLEKLKIDRQNLPEPTQVSLKKSIIIAIISFGLGSVFTFYFLIPTPAASDMPIPQIEAIQPELNAPLETTSKETQIDSKLRETPATTTILNASGYITARRMATVSSEVMGLIKEVRVEEGKAVEEGQILAKLDDTLAQVNLNLSIAQLETLQAKKKSAESSLAESQRQFKRIMNNAYSSEAEKTQSKTNIETLQANLVAATANIKVAKLEILRQRELLADHTIRAPFSGVVTMKNAQPGEIVAPSSAGGGFTRTGICTIVDMRSLEIEVDVNESFIGRVYSGQKVEANLDAYSDWTIPATVIAIIPTADRAKATVRVRIQINIKDKKILPEMGVKVAFLKSL